MSQPAVQKFSFKLLQRVFSFARPYKKKFIFSVCLAIVLAILAPLRPYLIQVSVNKGIGDGEAGFLISGVAGFLIEITIIQIGMLLLESVARFNFTFISASLGQNVVRDLRNKTYRKILGLQLRQFDRTPIGTLTTRTINDIESINDIFSDGFIPIVADLLSIFSVLAYMFWVDWKLTLICLIPFPFLILATYFFKESVNRSFNRVRNAVAALNTFVQEHISGMPVVQAFSAEQREHNNFKRINREHRDANIRAIFAYSVFFPIVELISAVSIGLLVWWAGIASVGNQANGMYAPGIITAFILCLNQLFRPLRVLADKFNVMQMGMIASERVFRVLDNNDVSVDKGKDCSPIIGEVEFEHVNFSYLSGHSILHDVSFKLEAGKTLAIVGSTGSGKTTIISLLNRLYPVSEGKITIDKKPIEDFSLDYLRSKIGVVLQDVFLFSGSVKENLTLRNDSISDEAVKTAAKLVGLHDFIMQLPGGYNYQIRERGVTLSVGQRQLLSFARALLFNPAILILDEATSSVDHESELLIQHAIDHLISGRTSIVIAHRLSTIRKADTILVLSKGKVIEMGNHESLLAANGVYANLFHMQFATRV
ncbi:MAG: ABC transporter ATP-binding protein [Ferruginibacter sp.]|nr:ABC transporter ATP-binding protein [Ferruginibacter sp.]